MIEKIKVKWHPTNKQHYEQCGYAFTKFGEEFEIYTNELTKGSHLKVRMICDYCGETTQTSFYNYYKHTNNGQNKCACNQCKTLKTQDSLYDKYGVKSPRLISGTQTKIEHTNLQRYGVKCVLQNEEIKNQINNTMLKKYGVFHALENEQCKEKMKNTCLEKYGHENAMSSPDIYEKFRQTCLERYGVDNPIKLDSVKNKAKNTCVKRYGGESSQCSPMVRSKTFNPLKSSNKVPSSKAEKLLVNQLIRLYGVDNCVPQYVFGGLSFDCLLNVGNVLIDVEYDGWYWHKNKQEYDKRRNYFVSRRGYKILRIIANTSIPTDEELCNAINVLCNTDKTLYKIILDNINIKDEDIV